MDDLNFPEAEGARSPMFRFISWYMTKLNIAARRDPVVALAFVKIANLMALPTSVMHPRIALRVLWGNLRPTKTPRPVESNAAPALTRS